MTDYPGFSFEITARDPAAQDQESRARIGRLQTPRGVIETPYYVFCGTKAAIKGIEPRAMQSLGTQIILSNTYHLLIEPGPERIAALGGLHRFTGWHGPMMTDSGGYQVFAMRHGSFGEDMKGKNPRNVSLLKVTEDAAHFRAYTDGREIVLTPESVMQTQRQLGANIVMPFDECTAVKDDYDYTARSMERSHRWEDRSLTAFTRLNTDGTQALWGIIQGGRYADLRKASAEYTRSRPFFGTAVGGSWGSTVEEMYSVFAATMPHVHPARPVHALGLGGIADVFEGVRLGMDSFDCVTPTRLGRHGTAMVEGVKGNKRNLRNAIYKDDPAPIDENCACPTCRNYSRAYLHHLLRVGEMLGPVLVTQHNVATINRLLGEIRAAIAKGELATLRSRWLAD